MHTTLQRRCSGFAKLGVALVALLVATLIGAGPAAADTHWTLSIGGDLAASGAYLDKGNWYAVTDEDSDGHSAVIVVWKPTSSNTNQQCWASGGEGDGVKCKLASSIATNGHQFYAKLCIGEFSGHRLLRCGAVRHLYA